MSVSEENARRNAILDQYYDPLTGEGSPMERKEFFIEGLEKKLFLPVSMMNLSWIQNLHRCGSMKAYINKHRFDLEETTLTLEPLLAVEELFMNTRLDHDFEYWAAVCAKIKPKKGGDFISFVLNYPQRELLKELESLRLADSAIFFILLKSRQFGGSTLIQLYMLWIQVRHRINWNSLIAAHINQAAANIRSMVTNVCARYPKDVDDITLKSFEGTQNIKIIPERSNKITIGSMETPDSIRSDDVKMAHISEAGLMKKTLGKAPEDLIQSILGSIPIDEPYVMFAIESTAKGVGNYFHRTWQQAVKNENGMKAIFIPWLKDPKNRIPLAEDEDPDKIFKSFNDYEKFLWKSGATLEGIKFYKRQLAVFNNDKWRMFSEFPTNAGVAFQSTGNRFFPAPCVLALRRDNVEPIFKGELVGDAMTGERSLSNLIYEENERGNLWIWKFPETESNYHDRYVVAMDIGGNTEKADFSVIRVFDRLPMLEGKDPEAILTWRGHIDADMLAWKGVQIASVCDNAIFVPEDNSMDKEKEAGGEHFHTILDQIKDYYPNIYIRNDEEKVGNDFIPKYGWQTNKKSKGLALDTLKRAARERMNKEENIQNDYCYIEYDERVCSEMDCYEIKANGSVGAADGEKDDLCMTTAIGLHVALSKLPLPSLKITEMQRRRKVMKSESTF